MFTTAQTAVRLTLCLSLPLSVILVFYCPRILFLTTLSAVSPDLSSAHLFLYVLIRANLSTLSLSIATQVCESPLASVVIIFSSNFHLPTFMSMMSQL